MSKIFSIQAEMKSSKTRYEKKIILKGDITAIYIEHEHRNTGASVLMLKKVTESVIEALFWTFC